MKLAEIYSARLGFLFHVVVVIPMIVAGVGKAFMVAPLRVIDMFATQFHLSGQMRMIGAGELLCVLLLLYPRTLPFGILMVSAYWGGAIVIHMTTQQSYALPAGLMLLSWAGYYLRMNRTKPSVQIG
jgi:hypothetical protein